MSTVLPAELLRSVVEHLRGDNQALATASLASSQFRTYCQEVLFSDVSIDYGYPKRLKSILQCLKSSSSLLKHIKFVTATVSDMHLDRDDAHHVAELLALLAGPQIQSFTLITRPVVWRMVLLRYPDVQEALEKLSRLPTLTSLSLIGIPIQWVSLRSPALVALSLSVVWDNDWMSSPTGTSIASAQECHLQALSIDYGPTNFRFIRDPANKIQLGKLKKLAIRPPHSAISPRLDIGLLLSVCAHSLEALECDASGTPCHSCSIHSLIPR